MSTEAQLRKERTGLFDCPEFSDATGFMLETRKCVEHSRKLVAAISAKASQPDPSIIGLMDELSDELCRVADLAECIRQVHPNAEISSAAQQACLAINSYVEELNTDRNLYAALRAFMDSSQYSELDEISKRTSEVFMHDFEISGIHLEESVRKQMAKLNNHLLEVGYEFSLNATQPTLVDSHKCSARLRQYYYEDNGKVHIDFVPYDSSNPDIRENGYRSFYTADRQKMAVFEEMITSRRKLAHLAGYPSFAHRVLRLSMAETPETVMNFLELLSEKIRPLAMDDVNTMKKISNSHPQIFKGGDVISPRDVSLLVSKAHNICFPSQKLEPIKNWFSMDSCIYGLGNLFKSLFGVNLEVLPVKEGEVWHPGVYKFGFFDEGGHLLGYTYGDVFSREGKMVMDCHFTIRGGREVTEKGVGTGTYTTPIITLCCSSEGPNSEALCLQSQGSVETLFHEMGHALHSMLGRARYQNITGTRCSTDFAEVPSTLMEFFLYDEQVLTSFAKHHKTSETLPASLITEFQLSNHLFAAYSMQVQIANAIADQKFHSSSSPFSAESAGWSEAVYRENCEKYSPLGHVSNTAYYLRFPHLCSYGGRYYSYLWSKAVASLIWKSSFSGDPFSRSVGERLRNMLSFGGGLNPRDLVRDMLGFEPTVEQLVDALCSDVIRRREQVRALSED